MKASFGFFRRRLFYTDLKTWQKRSREGTDQEKGRTKSGESDYILEGLKL